MCSIKRNYPYPHTSLIHLIFSLLMSLIVQEKWGLPFPRNTSSNICMKRRVELCPPGSCAFPLLIYNWNQVLWVTFTTVCALCFCFSVAIHHEPPVRFFLPSHFFSPPNQKRVDAIKGHARARVE